MLTLLSTLVSFLAGGLPKLLGFFQDRADKKHELTMAQLQIERELELRKAGFEAQQRVEEIKVEGQAIEAEASERAALYAHDIAIGQGASQWMINLRSGVRPILTYGFFGLFDPLVDNNKIFELVGPAFQTSVGGFIGLLAGVKLSHEEEKKC